MLVIHRREEKVQVSAIEIGVEEFERSILNE